MLRLRSVKSLLLALLVTCAISQDGEINEGLECFTNEEVIAIDAEITECHAINKINEELIKNYKFQISNYQARVGQDSSMIVLKNEEIKTLQKSVEEYKELNKLVQPKWYDNKWLYYAYGALTIYAGASVANTIGK